MWMPAIRSVTNGSAAQARKPLQPRHHAFERRRDDGRQRAATPSSAKRSQATRSASSARSSLLIIDAGIAVDLQIKVGPGGGSSRYLAASDAARIFCVNR